MAAVYVSNIIIESGTDFSQTFELELSDSNSPLPLNNFTIRSQMRKYAGSLNAITFDTSIIPPLSSGIISISLNSDQTTNIKPGRYVYDVIIDDGNIKTKVIEGMALVREGVTK